MLSMQSFVKSKTSSIMSYINQVDSMLILGKANNEYKLNEFVYPESYSEMCKMFGDDSELTVAYRDAINNGAKTVFVMNCYKTSDYIESISYVSQYNFAYVVPVGIHASDKFYLSETNSEMYFAEYYLGEFRKHTNSMLIFTEKHASLYENIDNYLTDMQVKISVFKDKAKYMLDLNGRNLAFCLNCLKESNYANVVLAASLCKTNTGEYPNPINYKSTYDFNSNDFYVEDIIYFKNNIHINTSIENLKNFRTQQDAIKLISIDRVIKYMERTLDTSFVIGKLYSQYVQMTLYDYLDEYFRKLMNQCIKNYAIKKINFVRGENLTGHILIDIDIYPINSLEQVSVFLEVK